MRRIDPRRAVRVFLAGTVCLAGFGLGVGGAASPAIAGKPGGVGANLHRSFMIRRAQRRAAHGLPTRRHAGIWLWGGYPQSTHYSYRQHSYWSSRNRQPSQYHWQWNGHWRR